MEIVSFGLGEPTNSKLTAEILGGKGAGLVWMNSLGIPVPPGFIIPTTECVAYRKEPAKVMAEVKKAIKPYLGRLKAKFGYMPLVSVRSGARQSMPGMMDTILNVGLDHTTLEEWEGRVGEDCANNSLSRLVEMYGSVVKGIKREEFHGISGSLPKVIKYEKLTGETFPGPEAQLLGAIEAVFKSWDNERAKFYRKQNGIPDDWGTAVTVQAMVFGNLNDKSGTGVLFTRNPDSGERKITGEFLINAQGEDVVAGTATPMPLSKMAAWDLPVAEYLTGTVEMLEKAKRDVQDVEFTIQDGSLYILQTRNAKRSARAAVRIAMEMLDEGILTTEEALKRVSFKEYLKAQADILDPAWKTPAAFTGIPACSGIVTGKVVKSSKDAVKASGPVILVTQETTPDDIAGMAAAKGVLTMTGGATSHAAVVARGMNRTCVVGLSASLEAFTEGAEISLDGATGRVWFGPVPVVSGAGSVYIKKIDALLKESSKARLIDEGPGDMVDVSGYLNDKPKAIAVIKEALKTRKSVIVDTREGITGAHQSYANLFGNPSREAEMVAALVKEFPKGKVRFLSNVKVPAAHSIARITKPEDFVMAEGDYMLEIAPAPWVEKLAKMKAQIDGSFPMSIGSLTGGVGFVSRVQLAASLLK